MRSAAPLIALSLALSACIEQKMLPSLAPPEADYMGAVILSEAGMRGSTLIPLEGGLLRDPLPITVSNEERFALVAYTRAQLEQTGAPLADFETGRLAPALACDQQLPSPVWSELYNSEGERVDETLMGPLTHQAFQRACPEQLGPLQGAVAGESIPCAPSATRSGCGLELALGDCALPSTTGIILSDGSVCITPPSGCESVDSATIECGGRAVSVTACEPDLEAQNVQVIELPQRSVPHSSTLSYDLLPAGLSSGWLSDLVVLEDRVVTASYRDGEGAPALRNVACRPISADLDHIPGMRLHIFDLQGNAIAEVEAPTCLEHMSPDPRGAGFLGFFRVDPDFAQQSPKFAIGRFDKDGAQVTMEPLPDDLLPEWRNAGFYYTLRATALSADSALLYALIDAPPTQNLPEPGFERLQGRVYAIDTSTLQVRFKSPLLDANANLTSIALTEDQALLVDHDGLAVIALNKNDLQVQGAVARFQNQPLLAVRPEGQPRAFIFERGITPAVSVLDETLSEPIPVVANGASTVSYATTWSARPGRLLTGAMLRADQFEELSLRIGRLIQLDIGAQRFIPCSQSLGLGPITRIQEGPNGDLFVLLPWEGKMVKLRAP